MTMPKFVLRFEMAVTAADLADCYARADADPAEKSIVFQFAVPLAKLNQAAALQAGGGEGLVLSYGEMTPEVRP